MPHKNPVVIFVIDSGEIEIIDRWALDGFCRTSLPLENMVCPRKTLPLVLSVPPAWKQCEQKLLVLSA